MRCELCNSPVAEGADCPSCLVYNAAVAAQKAAARSLAEEYACDPESAYLNEYGVFARKHGGGGLTRICPPEVAAPFVLLTGAVRRLTFPRGHCWDYDPVPTKKRAAAR